MTILHNLPYALTPAQSAFLDALRAACPLPVAALVDWVPKAEAVGLRLWLRDFGGVLGLAWEEVGAGAPEAGGGEATKGE